MFKIFRVLLLSLVARKAAVPLQPDLRSTQNKFAKGQIKSLGQYLGISGFDCAGLFFDAGNDSKNREGVSKGVRYDWNDFTNAIVLYRSATTEKAGQFMIDHGFPEFVLHKEMGSLEYRYERIKEADERKNKVNFEILEKRRPDWVAMLKRFECVAKTEFFRDFAKESQTYVQ